MINILLIQGCNMNLLGIREPEIYGRTSAAELNQMLAEYARSKGLRWRSFTRIPKVNVWTELSGLP